MAILTELFGPRPKFDGGLFLPDHKSVTARRPIETLTVTETLHVPLRTHRNLTTQTLVRPGDRVLTGQHLADALDAAAVPVHAPTSGTIRELRPVWSPLEGMLPGAVLEPDHRHEPMPATPGHWSAESFITQLAECGALCPRPRMPTHRFVQEAAAAGVAELIVNAMETEPYLTADLRTIVEEPGRMIDATCEFADALGVQRVIVALPYRHRRLVRRVQSEALGRFIEVEALSNPYPHCEPNVLVKAVLDREAPPGGSPLDVGVVVMPLAAIRGGADALLSDRPTTHAVMTIAGDAADRIGTYRVAVGTPIADLTARVGLLAPVARAICGGPLTGVDIGHPDAVVTADMNALLLFATSPDVRPVPCVRCGWCIEDCPVGLDPVELVQLETRDGWSPPEQERLNACVECGLCSYVCPAELPLADTIRRLRGRSSHPFASEQVQP